VSSLTKRNRSGRPGTDEPMPPDLRALGAIPFGRAQQVRLDSWLREGGWPRHHMDIAELEGFLVALVAWPVDITPGAWLPPVWGERGWKIPAKLAKTPQREEFVTLIVGFLQALDRELSVPQSRFDSSVLRTLRGEPQAAGIHRWGRGFMTALSLGSQGLKGRSASAGDAVRTIANVTSASATIGAATVEEVVGAVRALVEQRVSRGPLGSLEAVPDAPTKG